MASKSRGGLSKNEVAANKAGISLSAYKASKGGGSSSYSGAPKAPSYGSFKFDSSKLVPQYQAEAASIYNPQIQQIQGLQSLTKAQSEDAKVKTNDEFAQLLKREQENINRRGAFFSGGAIDQENRIGAQQAGAIRDIGFQEQSANLQYQGTLSEIAQAQKDYVSSKVEGAYSSAYKTFQDQIANQMNQYQLELGQYNTDRTFEQNKLESDRNYALSAAASARAGANSGNAYSDIDAAFKRNNGDWDATAAELAGKYDVSEGSVVDNELRRRNGLAPIGSTATTKEQQAQISAANQASSAANAVVGLLNTKGKSGAVGAKGLSSFFGLKETPVGGTDAAGYVAKLDQVKSLLVMPELAQLRGLGAMSDREFGTISAAATSLSRSTSEKDFDTELERVQGALSGTLNKAAEMGIFKPNYINVYDLNSGKEGTIPDYEYNPSKYQKK